MIERRLAAATVLAALVAVALRAGPASAEPPSRTFEEKNFRWTLPSDAWSFEDPTEDDKAVGAVVFARRVVSPGVQVDGRVTVRDAGGSDIDSLLTQVREVKEAAYADTKIDKPSTVRWAGARAGLLRLSGKAANGSAVAFRVYLAVVGGVMHMLDVRMSNGADTQAAPEVDALAAGYRLLKGGSDGGDLPPDHPPVGPGAGGEPGEGPAPEGATTDPNPLKKTFPGLGLTWTLPPPHEAEIRKSPPEGGEPVTEKISVRWAWATDGDPNLKKGGQGTVATAVLLAGDDQPLSVRLRVQPGQPGGTAAGFVTNSGNADGITKDNFSDTPIPRIDEDVKIGNWHGGVLILTGKGKSDQPLQVRMYAAVLQSVVHLFYVGLDGSQAEKKWRDDLKACLGGLTWADTKEGVRGPVATPFLAHTEPRGKAQGEEKKVLSPAFTLVKPPLFAQLDYVATAQEYKDWRFAAEARKDGAYCFVGILSWPADFFAKQRPAKDPDSMIDERENDWKNAMLETVTRPKSDKTNRASGEFAGKKSSTYEFRGTYDRQPFLERGWLFKAGQQVFLARIQYGGKDAETAFADEVKALVKSFSPGK